jgi:hypothetical protein
MRISFVDLDVTRGVPVSGVRVTSGVFLIIRKKLGRPVFDVSE